MITWLDIDGGTDGCTVSLVQGGQGAQAAGDRVLPLLAQLSALQRPLSVPGIESASTSNMTATLDNARARVTTLWGQRPPMRRAGRVMSPAGTLFEGVVTGLDLGADAVLSMEAGLDRPLSDSVPLRTTSVWGSWRDVQVLPWVYGAATLTPIQYSDDQRVYVLADHPIAGVDAVTRDDVPTVAYAWSNGVDSTGHAVAFIELAEPLAEGERLAVTLRGRMHPDTGRLLQTAAEIVYDLLASLAGAPVTWADLDDYRTETAELVLGGVLADNTVSIRAAVDAVVQSAGGAWSTAMPGIAMTWPPAADDAAPAVAVTPLTATDLKAGTAATGIYTVLRVLYDYDNAGGRYRRAIELQAPDAAKEFGRLELEWNAPWLRTPRHAEALGQRMLAWLARPRWRVTWTMSFADVATGAWVNIEHPLSPISGRHRLLNAELDLSAASLACTAEAPVGAPPAIETTQLSTAFEPVIQAGISVEVAKGQIIFTARDDQGHAMAGARITLDGQTTRIADSAGRVSFSVARGRHTITVQADGYATTETVVTV